MNEKGIAPTHFQTIIGNNKMHFGAISNTFPMEIMKLTHFEVFKRIALNLRLELLNRFY